MSTNLKKFHTSLMSIQKNEKDLNDLHRCYQTRDQSIPLDEVSCQMSDGKDVSFKELYSEMLGMGYSLNNYDAFVQDLKDIQDGVQDSIARKDTNVEKSKKIEYLRNNLDKKMRELYDPTQNDEYSMYHTTIYMSMGWTILGASIIYYISQQL